jgi:hypothetical protein
VEDCSKNEEAAKTLQEEYGIDFASCVGALLYLSYTRPDILYALSLTHLGMMILIQAGAQDTL